MKTNIPVLFHVFVILFTPSMLLAQENRLTAQYKMTVGKNATVAVTGMQDDLSSVIETTADAGARKLNSQPLPNLTYNPAGQNTFSYDPGENKCEFRTSVRNMGATTSPICLIAWYLSKDTNITTEDFHVCDVPVLQLLPFAYPTYEIYNAGGIKDLESFCDIPAGTYYAGWYIDFQNVVAESNESDNSGYWSEPTIILRPNIQLATVGGAGEISFSYFPATHVCTFKYHVVNHGPAMVGEFDIGFFLSKDKTLSPNKDILIGTERMHQLYYGESQGGDMNIFLGETMNLQSGTYYGAIYADYNFKIDERIETDNFKLFNNPKVNWTSNMQPEVRSISPDRAENTGVVEITNLSGSGFDHGAEVILQKQNEDDIFAHDIVVENINNIACRFNLWGAAPGVWNVMVKNPNGKTSGQSGARLFTVTGQPSNIIWVINTSDSGRGSLRNAILKANIRAGADTIYFAIPTTDPGLDTLSGVWTITPQSPFPWLRDDSTVIDGFSQAAFAGDLNQEGPEIQLNGAQAGDTTCGFFIRSAYNVLQGLIINEYREAGILLADTKAHHNTIIDNYIGVNASATEILPNKKWGIYIYRGAENSIGTFQLQANGNPVLKKRQTGRRMSKKAIDAQVPTGGNIIAGNHGGGILIYGEEAKSNLILANNIVANYDDGITLAGGASGNLVFYNVIALNKGHGVEVLGAPSIENTITVNSICANEEEGIYLNGGNLMLASPVVFTATPASVTGSGPAHAFIEIYADQENEGEVYLGSSQCDDRGFFGWTGFTSGPNVTAIAIDDAGNTSQFSAPCAFGTSEELAVTTTANSGEGSLRRVLQRANSAPGPNTIVFRIPASDPNYNSSTGVWTIRPESRLPEITDNDLVINGFSQAEFIGNDANPYGPEIELDGSLLSDSPGLWILASRIIIAELVFNRFPGQGVFLAGVDGGFICGCYIGTDPTGKLSMGNWGGVHLYNKTKNFIIGPPDSTLPGNIISGNISSGVFVSDSSRHNQIVSNVIGLDRDGGILPESNPTGIFFNSGSDSNTVQGNLIGGNRGLGVQINNSNNIHIIGNGIGTDGLFESDLGNQNDGIQITGVSACNQISENLIGYNKNNGISVKGQSAVQNRLSQNLIYGNTNKGIELEGGNAEISPPILISASTDHISGTSGPNQIIEVYADEGNQGKYYLGSTVSESSGEFVMNTGVELPLLVNTTAIAMDSLGNTSEFSAPLAVGIIRDNVTAHVKKFTLGPNFPNPFNATTTINMSLPEPDRVTLEIFNTLGQKITTLLDREMNAGVYEISWNATNDFSQPVPSGLYLCRLQSGEYHRTIRLVLLK